MSLPSSDGTLPRSLGRMDRTCHRTGLPSPPRSRSPPTPLSWSHSTNALGPALPSLPLSSRCPGSTGRAGEGGREEVLAGGRTHPPSPPWEPWGRGWGLRCPLVPFPVRDRGSGLRESVSAPVCSWGSCFGSNGKRKGLWDLPGTRGSGRTVDSPLPLPFFPGWAPERRQERRELHGSSPAEPGPICEDRWKFPDPLYRTHLQD